MNAGLRVRPATEADCHALAAVMRAEDVAEVRATENWSPRQALLESLARSNEAFAVEVEWQLAGVFGHRPFGLLGGMGQVWLLTGPAIEKRPLAFLRAAREFCHRLLWRYDVLVSSIDARYVRAVRFFRLVGFSVGEPEPLWPGGVDFHFVQMRRAS